MATMSEVSINESVELTVSELQLENSDESIDATPQPALPLRYDVERRQRILCAILIVIVIFFILIGVVCALYQYHVAPSGAEWHDTPQPGLQNISQEERVAIAQAILEFYPLVDGHNDLAWQFQKRQKNIVWSVDLKGGWPDVLTDIPRLRQGRVGAQFWSVYTQCASQYIDSVRLCLNQLDTIKKFVNRYQHDLQWVTTAQGIEDAFREGRIGSLVGMEGGHCIDSSLGNLRMFYELGVRYMTLTHSCNTPWADNWAVDDNNTSESNGLSAFGEQVVREMNRLGMMVDLSHTAKQTMTDALNVSVAPIIFSHSSSYSVCPHHRNVQDDVLDLVRDNGGVVMVTFVNDYVNCSHFGSLNNVADHIDHIKNQIGVDHVGLGGDFDGVPVDHVPTGLKDVSTYPDLFAELLLRGWTKSELEKLAGRNIMRVFRKVEKVRDSLLSTPPDEQLISQTELKNSSCRTDDFKAQD